LPSNPNIELRHLRAFAMVAQELHFTRAAARMHLSQQAVSTHVRQLERELDVALFLRTTRTVELTEAGVTLNRHVTDLLAALDIAVGETRRRGTGAGGTIRVGHVPAIGRRGMQRLVACMSRNSPGVELLGRECWMQEAINALNDGRLDAALVTFASHGPELASTMILREPLGVILGRSHPAAASDSVRVDSLITSKLAIFPREISPGLFDRAMAAFPVHARQQRVLDDPACRREIGAGHSFFIMPEGDGAWLPTSLVWRPLEPQLMIDLDLVWRSPIRSEVVRRFVGLVGDDPPRQG
jgi:DNA-binding transcriptional LysR family regulator